MRTILATLLLAVSAFAQPQLSTAPTAIKFAPHVAVVPTVWQGQLALLLVWTPNGTPFMTRSATANRLNVCIEEIYKHNAAQGGQLQVYLSEYVLGTSSGGAFRLREWGLGPSYTRPRLVRTTKQVDLGHRPDREYLVHYEAYGRRASIWMRRKQHIALVLTLQ